MRIGARSGGWEVTEAPVKSGGGGLGGACFILTFSPFLSFPPPL